MPTIEETGFLRDIASMPFDPAPRLLYADWLEEHGDRRAGFIRAVVEGRGAADVARGLGCVVPVGAVAFDADAMRTVLATLPISPECYAVLMTSAYAWPSKGLVPYDELLAVLLLVMHDSGNPGPSRAAAMIVYDLTLDRWWEDDQPSARLVEAADQFRYAVTAKAVADASKTEAYLCRLQPTSSMATLHESNHLHESVAAGNQLMTAKNEAALIVAEFATRKRRAEMLTLAGELLWWGKQIGLMYRPMEVKDA